MANSMKKKHKEEESEPDVSEEELSQSSADIEPSSEDQECGICGVLSPPGASECIACRGALSGQGGETEPAEEITPKLEEPIVASPEVEEEGPAWSPLSDKDAKAVEKAIKKDVKALEKQLKKGEINQEEHDTQVKQLRVEHGLEPPEPAIEEIPEAQIPEVAIGLQGQRSG